MYRCQRIRDHEGALPVPRPSRTECPYVERPGLHTRLWADPTSANAYVGVIDTVLIDAITGKQLIEIVADARWKIVMSQVRGETMIIDLWNHFYEMPMKLDAYRLALAAIVNMKRRAEA